MFEMTSFASSGM